MNNPDIKPLAKSKDLLVQQADKELLLYDLNTNKAYCLNETSAAVWQLCDGTNSITDITDNLQKASKSEIPADLIALALFDLQREKLIDDMAETTALFGKLTRREVVRRIGLTTMVALPLISSVIVPTSIAAQSPVAGTCANPGLQSCTTPQNCLNGDTCTSNCCVTGGAIPGTGTIGGPGGPSIIFG